MVGKMSNRDVLLTGLGLYWGEGYKKGSQEFGFTNSDLGMLQFYLYWLKVCFRVKKKDLILRVSINEAHKSRVKDVESYWSTNLGISLVQFTKISLIKSVSKRVYSNQSEHYGTLRVKVRRGARLHRTVLGAIKHLSQVKAE